MLGYFKKERWFNMKIEGSQEFIQAIRDAQNFLKFWKDNAYDCEVPSEVVFKLCDDFEMDFLFSLGF